MLAGYPVVDIQVALTDGCYHEVDSNEMAFKIAASMGFKEGCRKAKPVLLEPVMDVEVVTPAEFHGGGRGRPQQPPGQDPVDGGPRQRAGHPGQRAAGQMFGYATDVRSMTQGRATYTMQFARYEEVPRNLAEEIMAKSRGEGPPRSGSR